MLRIFRELRNAPQHFHRLNSSEMRYDFYPLKRVVLKRWGVADGWDLQRIVKTCWHCNGTGLDLVHEWCDRCDGTGNYRDSTYYLQRYRFEGRGYHLPVEADELIGEQRGQIDGFVQHRGTLPPPNSLSINICLLRYAPDLIFWRTWHKWEAKLQHWWRWRRTRPRRREVPTDDIPF